MLAGAAVRTSFRSKTNSTTSAGTPQNHKTLAPLIRMVRMKGASNEKAPSYAGPAKFLEGYKGYLQADAYSVYDAFFKPQRGMTEVGCWMHARRYLFKALESDEPHMGPALHLIARLYRVEERAKALSLSADSGWHCASAYRRD